MKSLFGFCTAVFVCSCVCICIILSGKQVCKYGVVQLQFLFDHFSVHATLTRRCLPPSNVLGLAQSVPGCMPPSLRHACHSLWPLGGAWPPPVGGQGWLMYLPPRSDSLAFTDSALLWFFIVVPA